MPAAELRKVGVFDGPGRDPRGPYSTTAYVAVLPEPVTSTAGDDARDPRWWSLNGAPKLAFDHADIITTATSTAGHGKAGA